MKHATILLAVGTALLLTGPTAASAQTKGDEALPFIALYGGAQPQRHSFTAVNSFPKFDETATVTSTQNIRNGVLVQLGLGYPIVRGIGVGARVWDFGRPGTASIEAKVPSPSFFDAPTLSHFDESGLKHTELGVHINLLYQRPINRKIDLTISVGPSLIQVKQDVASAEVANDGTVKVTKLSQQGKAVGANGGVDVGYRFSTSLALGIFVHYAGGKVDLPAVTGMTVGGAQGGLFVRLSL